MQNYTKVGTIPWDFKVVNPCFNFCVGGNVGGHLAIPEIENKKTPTQKSYADPNSRIRPTYKLLVRVSRAGPLE